MIATLIYQIDPEALADVDSVAFAAALKRELSRLKKFRRTEVKVKVAPGRSQVMLVECDDIDDGRPDMAALTEQIKPYAERAFRKCCE